MTEVVLWGRADPNAFKASAVFMAINLQISMEILIFL